MILQVGYDMVARLCHPRGLPTLILGSKGVMTRLSAGPSPAEYLAAIFHSFKDVKAGCIEDPWV